AIPGAGGRAAAHGPAPARASARSAARLRRRARPDADPGARARAPGRDRLRLAPRRGARTRGDRAARRPPQHGGARRRAHEGASPRGAGRECGALALRGGLLRRAELGAALTKAPPTAREDGKVLADALVAARALARGSADQVLTCSIIERDQPSFEIEGYYLVE